MPVCVSVIGLVIVPPLIITPSEKPLIFAPVVVPAKYSRQSLLADSAATNDDKLA